MIKSILRHKQQLAFSIALVGTSMLGGSMAAHATPTVSNGTQNTHPSACVKIGGNGTLDVWANGARNFNKQAGATLQMVCPLQDPMHLAIDSGDGSANTNAIGLDVYDGSNDNTSTGYVSASACTTNRVANGGGCGTLVKTATGTTDTFVGYVGLNLTGVASLVGDNFGPQYLLVTLPNWDAPGTGSATQSYIRSYGVAEF